MPFANAKGSTLEPSSGTPTMTNEAFGRAYQKGFNSTVRFLVSRGISYEMALDTAQDAWTKSWEKRDQLRQPSLVLTWTNTIALNVYRSLLRRERQTEPLAEVEASTDLNIAAIDVERILKECKANDRLVLEEHYIEGYRTTEIAKLHDCSETAVRIRLLRARRKLKQHVLKVRPGGRLTLVSASGGRRQSKG